LGSEPRIVKAGVVGGSFFDVMGLRPVLGRLLDGNDDGPKAAGVAVLTYRVWAAARNSDPTVVGRTVRARPGPARRGRGAGARGSSAGRGGRSPTPPTPRSSRTS